MECAYVGPYSDAKRCKRGPQYPRVMTFPSAKHDQQPNLGQALVVYSLIGTPVWITGPIAVTVTIFFGKIDKPSVM